VVLVWFLLPTPNRTCTFRGGQRYGKTGAKPRPLKGAIQGMAYHMVRPVLLGSVVLFSNIDDPWCSVLVRS